MIARSMTQTFECPSCGGPLDLPRDGSPTIRCSYCGRNVIVPPELQGTRPAGTAGSPGNIGSEILKEIDRLLAAGNKIAAIQQYRNATGSSLREAKDFIDRRAAGEEAGTTRSAEQPPAVTIVFPERRLLRRRARGGRAVWVAAVIVLAIMLLSSLPALIGPGALLASLRRSFESQPGATVTLRTIPVLSTMAPPTRVTTPTALPYAQPVLAFGGEGIGPGLFEDARSIAVDPDGNIYVGEYTGGRIQVFDPQGKFVTQWTVDAEMPLRGLAVDRQGIVYVVQGGQIDRYDGSSGDALGTLEYAQGWGFDDVAVVADGGLVAAWYNNRDDLVRLDDEGQLSLVIPGAISSQSGDSELNTRVAVDGLGNIYALGTFNDAVFKFNAQGRFLTRFGSAGDEPGQFRAPGSIAVDGQGRVYVGDFKGIQVFDSNGRYLELIEFKGVPSGLTFSDSGDLFVAARTQVFVFKINP
jgi:LSD1 subclass zinc finger protein